MMKLVELTLVFLVVAGVTLPVAQPQEDWEPYAQREVLKQVYSREGEVLSLESCGEFRCNGSWKRAFPVSAGQYYRFSAEANAEGVSLERRAVLMKVDWLTADKERTGFPEYPYQIKSLGGGWRQIESVFLVPEKAEQAIVELILRWTPAGKVSWRNIQVGKVEKPASRKVHLATVNFRPSQSSGPGENLEKFGAFVKQAGEAGADIVGLPEGITVVGTGKSYGEVAEPIPGESTKFLGELARKYSIHIVAGIYELEGETVYNTSVLIGRDGSVVGKYRKVSLPREEIEGGITPGDEFPVFETDIGRIGMLICWDIHFPEGARRLAAAGAEIIFLPIWGGNEMLFPARTIENQLFLVTSSYDAPTGIWDRRGAVLALAENEGELAFAEVDLAEQTYWEWLGNFYSRIGREAPQVKELEPR